MFVYIMTNKPKGTLYIGVTGNLVRRVFEHLNHLAAGFTNRYNLTQLAWFEGPMTPDVAIQREKSLKRWSRAWKVALIEEGNPQWLDLWPHIAGAP